MHIPIEKLNPGLKRRPTTAISNVQQQGWPQPPPIRLDPIVAQLAQISRRVPYANVAKGVPFSPLND